MKYREPSPSKKPEDAVRRESAAPGAVRRESAGSPMGTLGNTKVTLAVTMLLVALVPVVRADTIIDLEEHCEERALGPVCDFSNVDDVVVLSGDVQLPTPTFLEMEIHNARRGVHIYPSCISWVQIYNSNNISTRSELGNSCRTWLRAYNSSLDYVAHGVKDLTLYESSAQEVSLKNQRDFTAINSSITHVKDVSWKGYPGIIRNSTLEQISKMTVQDDFSVSGSHIGTIGTRAISIRSPRTTEIINTTVGLIETEGVNLDSENVVVKLVNVTIDEVASQAFVVDTNSKLHLENVTIARAAKPFIRTLFPESVIMEQVTIAGEAVTTMADWHEFILTGLDSEVGEFTKKLNLSLCKSNETTYECNLSNKDMVVMMIPPDIDTLVLRGGSSILLENSSCPHHLILDSHKVGIEGVPPQIISLFALASRETTTPELSSALSHCDMSLDATLSEIEVLDGGVTKLRIRDSLVQNMRLENVTDVLLINTTITNLHQMVVQGEMMTSIVSITTMSGLELQKSTVLDDLTVKVIKPNGLTVNHDGRSLARRMEISFLDDSAIEILQGTLEMKDVTVKRGIPKGFKLSRNATLVLHNVTFSIQDLRIFRIFYVFSRDQVEMKDVRMGQELLDTMDEPRLQKFFHVYGHDLVFGDDVIYISKDKKSCTSAVEFMISTYCSFPPKSEKLVILDGEILDEPELVVSDARNLIVLPTCHRVVVILRTLNGTTMATPSTCLALYKIADSTFTNLTSGFHDLSLKDSRVKLLAPADLLQDVDLFNVDVERVEALAWKGYMATIKQSRIGTVAGLKAGSTFMCFDTHIDTVESGGMEIDADSVISNTTFDVIKTGGIVVTNNVMIGNTTIHRLERKGIIIHGILILNNVTIIESDEDSIVASDAGGVAFVNVTVGGQSVHWVGYIATKNDESAIFLNKKKDEVDDGDPKDDATVPDESDASGKKIVVPATTTQATSEETLPSVQVVMSASATRRAAVTPVPETSRQIDSLEVPPQSLTWTGVGVGLLVGLLCSVAMIAIYIACSRSDRGRMLGPVMSWRSAEDRDELLVNDLSDVSIGGERAAASSSTTSSGATSSYQEVPRTEGD